MRKEDIATSLGLTTLATVPCSSFFDAMSSGNIRNAVMNGTATLIMAGLVSEIIEHSGLDRSLYDQDIEEYLDRWKKAGPNGFRKVPK
jgi:hypothetical protein